MEGYTEYDVYANFAHEDGSLIEHYVGSLELPTIGDDHSNAPIELEIDGIVYYPQL